jgi:hypothetical protein
MRAGLATDDVMIITNPKVRGFIPLWAPFRGVSLLFDNPADPATTAEGRPALEAPDDPACLYRRLASALAEIGPDSLARRHLFCPLPPSSYHVTVWDAVNAGNLARLPGHNRGAFSALLEGLPDSLEDAERVLEADRTTGLITGQQWDVGLRFARLSNWSGVSIVAELAPVDAASEGVLRRLQWERGRVNGAFEARFGLATVDPCWFVPHVSLGYFANPACADVSPRLEEWNALFERRTRGCRLRFRTISLYGFTDMARFFKRPTPAPSAEP